MLLPEPEEAHLVFCFHDHDAKIQSFVFYFEGYILALMDLAGPWAFPGSVSHPLGAFVWH